MSFPVPTSLGQIYTDTVSGRSWVCTSLNPPIWGVNKIANVTLGGGLVAGGDIGASGNGYFGKGIVLSPCLPNRYTGIGTQNYFDGFYSVGYVGLTAGGITGGAFTLAVSQIAADSYGDGLGYGLLHLLAGTGGSTGVAAIRVIRGATTQAYVNYNGEYFSKGVYIGSDINLKSNIANYTDSTVRFGKWLPAIKNNISPYSFTYTDSPDMGKRYGYLAQNIASADPVLSKSDFLLSEGTTGFYITVTGPSGDPVYQYNPNLTGTTQYFISMDQLLFGAVEAIRELDAATCRLWTTPCLPPPSRIKDGDFWFEPTTSKMYMRFNDGTQSQWIQTS
jgi:Chaperone of endosialidase